MCTRVLSLLAFGGGVVLGAIAILAAPAMVLVAAMFGAVIGVGAGWSVRAACTGDAAVKVRAGRRGGLIAGGGAAGGWLVLTGLALLLGPTSGLVVLVAVMITMVVWVWSHPEPGAALRANPLRAAQNRLLRAAQPINSPRHLAAPLTHDPLNPAPLTPVRPNAAGCNPSGAGVPAPMSWSLPVSAALSTRQLCVAWQRTYFMLRELPPGAPRDEIVGVRQQLLEEIERRDPEGFSRWLDLGARPGSDPGRYLAGDR